MFGPDLLKVGCRQLFCLSACIAITAVDGQAPDPTTCSRTLEVDRPEHRGVIVGCKRDGMRWCIHDP